MALREALDNPKTFRLARIIGCEPWGALGLFEAVRQWMQTYRKNGGVTSEDLLDAGAAIHFSGDLEDVLSRAGYLDKMERGDEASRGYTCYYFHDWETHCEDSVHMALARAGEFFANGSKPKMGRLSKEEREKAERLYAEQAGAQCAQSVRTESALPNHTIPIEKEKNNAGAREGTEAWDEGRGTRDEDEGPPRDPWANDEGFSPEVMKADNEWGNHMFRKYQHVRDSECILADRRFLTKQADPDECVNLAIRSGWRTLKPVFGPSNGVGRGTRDEGRGGEQRKHPDLAHDFDEIQRTIKAKSNHEADTVEIVRFKKGTKEPFDFEEWYRSRGLAVPARVIRSRADNAPIAGVGA